MIETEFKKNKIQTSQSCHIYFTSYYLNKFLNTDLNIQSYIGYKNKDQIKEVFILLFPFKSIISKENKKIFNRYFEEAIRANERYTGIIKSKEWIAFLFKHDEELLNAFKTGNYSKIPELKKSKMKKSRIIDFDIKVRAFYIVGNNNPANWKNYPIGKKDAITYELSKMIYPETFYSVLAEQFNVKTEYLKKNQVQILPKPELDKYYLELSGNEDIILFDKKQ